MKNFRRSIAILLVAVMTFVPTMASLADICAPEEHVYQPVKDEYDETIYYECEICDATVSNAEYEEYCAQEKPDELMLLTGLLGVQAPTNWSLLERAMAGEDQASVPGVFEVIEGDNERTIILYADIEAGADDGTLNVPDDNSIVLRMNEHIIDANEGDFSVISVNPEASLSIIGPGKITGSKNSGNGGGIYNQGKLKLYWSVDIEKNEAKKGAGIYNEGDISADLCYYVKINNNIAENQGGGIYTSKYLLLDSKYSIENCTANLGGAIYVPSNGFLEGIGGKIENCRAIGTFACGGGVYVENGGTVTLSTAGSSTGVSIKGCSAKTGGGVYSEGAIGVDNIAIKNNTASEYGGGIYLGEGGSIFLGRKATITGNTQDNLFLTANVLLTKFGTGEDVQPPVSGMKIGVTTETVPTVGNPVQITSNGTEEYDGYIISDNADYKVVFNSDHFELSAGYRVTFDTQGGTEVQPQTVEHGGNVKAPKDDPTKAECEFAGWYTDVSCADGTEYDFNKPVTKNITLYAKWIVKPTITIDTAKTEYELGEKIELEITTIGNTEIDVTDGMHTWHEVTTSGGKATFSDPSKTSAGTYTYTVTIPQYKVSASIDIIVKKGADPNPKKKSSNNSSSLFTGTWNNAVSNGNWSQDANGVWHYTTIRKFTNTWGYIVNPYATAGQNSADWFYFDAYGNMLTGWQFIQGKWYYLNPSKDGTLGACQLGGVTPDGWTVDESGAWVESIPKK